MKGCKNKTYRKKYVGGCGGQCPMQLGGNFYKPANLVPSSTAGNPWTPDTLPGSTNIAGNNGYFKLNTYSNGDPQTSIKTDSYNLMGGSKKFKRTKRFKKMKGGYVYEKDDKTKKRDFIKGSDALTKGRDALTKGSDALTGGGFIPQELVNIGRGFMYNMNTAYNAVNGQSAPINPLPFKDQFKHSLKY
jgi:hypothetical protein